jgi:hypothetical protein
MLCSHATTGWCRFHIAQVRHVIQDRASRVPITLRKNRLVLTAGGPRADIYRLWNSFCVAGHGLCLHGRITCGAAKHFGSFLLACFEFIVAQSFSLFFAYSIAFTQHRATDIGAGRDCSGPYGRPHAHGGSSTFGRPRTGGYLTCAGSRRVVHGNRKRLQRREELEQRVRALQPAIHRGDGERRWLFVEL